MEQNGMISKVTRTSEGNVAIVMDSVALGVKVEEEFTKCMQDHVTLALRDMISDVIAQNADTLKARIEETVKGGSIPAHAGKLLHKYVREAMTNVDVDVMAQDAVEERVRTIIDDDINFEGYVESAVDAYDLDESVSTEINKQVGQNIDLEDIARNIMAEPCKEALLAAANNM